MSGLRVNIRKLPGVFMCFCAAAAATVLVAYPQQAVCGAGEGLRICAGVVVPSLFPFLALSAFAAASPSCKAALRFLSPLMRHIFRLPAAATPAVLFGIIGGYPVGCTTAYRLFSRNEITAEQAQRLTCFCVNAGPAFVITAVGSVMLGSIRAGIILFASCVLSSLLIGIMLGFTAEKPTETESDIRQTGGEIQALVDGTEKAAQSIIKICAWTVLFSCISAVLQAHIANDRLFAVLKCITEVTSGCAVVTQSGNLCAVAATLGWGGLCVCCQVLESVKKCGASLSVFFAFRAVNSALAAVICSVLLRFFPIEQSVFSNVASVTANRFSYSACATAALMCLCIVFVIDLDRSRKMC